MKIVVTKPPKGNLCECQFCKMIIAKLIDNTMIPTAEECYKNGNVPVPNFGWFCSQECASEYEKKNDIRFARTSEGKIDYYTLTLR